MTAKAPPPYLDEHQAIVGQSGSGKSFTAKVQVEELLRQRRHVVIIDITDVWWGLRSDAAGTGDGFDIPIFGGPHGDVPIGPGDGDAIARLIIEQRISAIVSLAHMHDDVDQRAFLAPFVKRLRSKPRGNFHLIADEAEEIAPQTAPDDLAFALTRDLTWIAKRGRVFGFVLTVITQRPADIAKAVLSQSKTIIAHSLIDPRDQKAIDDYLKAKGDKESRAEVMGSLAALDQGERWIYSPRLGILERGRTPAISTFDSSRTPAPGEDYLEPKTLSQIDVSAIAAALKGGSADAPIGADPGPEAADRMAALEQRNQALAGELVDLRAAYASRGDQIAHFEGVLAAINEALKLVPATQAPATKDLRHAGGDRGGGTPPPGPPHDAGEGEARAASRSLIGGNAGGASPTSDKPDPDKALARGRAALPALAANPGGLTEQQWAWVAGFSRKGGTFKTYKSALRSAGLAEEREGKWFLTAAGRAQVDPGAPKPPALGPELVRSWAAKISGVTRMLEVLLKRWPDMITREVLAAELGMSIDGGTFKTYVSRLRGHALLQEQGKKVRLNPDLMGPRR